MKLYKMIEIYLKYDNVHAIRTSNAFICTNNHVNSCINGMLSVPREEEASFDLSVRSSLDDDDESTYPSGTLNLDCYNSLDEQLYISTACLNHRLIIFHHIPLRVSDIRRTRFNCVIKRITLRHVTCK